MKINNIDKKITNQIDLLKLEIKKLDFEIINEFNLQSFNEKIKIENINFMGIYFFEIRKSLINQNIDTWINNFTKNWEKEIFKFSPNVRKKSLKNFNKDSDWIPLYIGRSRKIGQRVYQHVFKKNEKKTYALKLLEKKFLKNEKFRLKIMKMEVVNYDQIMPVIELEMRKIFHPIVGKQ